MAFGDVAEFEELSQPEFADQAKCCHFYHSCVCVFSTTQQQQQKKLSNLDHAPFGFKSEYRCVTPLTDVANPISLSFLVACCRVVAPTDVSPHVSLLFL